MFYIKPHSFYQTSHVFISDSITSLAFNGVCIKFRFDLLSMRLKFLVNRINEPVHEISNNLVCATSKASDQPAHMRSLIRAFAGSLSIL